MFTFTQAPVIQQPMQAIAKWTVRAHQQELLNLEAIWMDTLNDGPIECGGEQAWDEALHLQDQVILGHHMCIDVLLVNALD